MQILVTRDIKTALSVTSQITIDGGQYGFGLEPPVPIQAGEYEAWLRWSAKNDRWVIAVMNVPGHTDVEVHIGNFPKDTKLCLLVGLMRFADSVINSGPALTQLMSYMINHLPLERVTIKYVDAYEVKEGV